MMINVIDSENFKPKKGENYFFDNNIWMYLFCSIGNYKSNLQKSSSIILSKIKSTKANIYINNLILSEFANAYLRLEYNIWKENQPEDKTDFKKNFRLTDRFKETQLSIIENINRIVKLSTFTDDDLLNIDIKNVLEKMNNIDFNNAYYIELCKKNEYKLVSNDNDFLNLNVNLDIIKL